MTPGADERHAQAHPNRHEFHVSAWPDIVTAHAAIVLHLCALRKAKKGPGNRETQPGLRASVAQGGGELVLCQCYASLAQRKPAWMLGLRCAVMRPGLIGLTSKLR
jgi:hypothetical protein